VKIKERYNFIFVYIRVDVNKISVLAAGLNFSCSARYRTVINGDWNYNNSAGIFKIISFILQTDKRALKKRNYEVFLI